MKKNIILSALVLTLATSGAWAQSPPDRPDQRGPQMQHDQDRGGHDDRRGPDGPRAGPADSRHGPDMARGAGPGHRFHKGDRLDKEYRHRQYVVDDWRVHRLSAPPRGYHWVQSGGDYMLIAISTGIIAQIVLGN